MLTNGVLTEVFIETLFNGGIAFNLQWWGLHWVLKNDAAGVRRKDLHIEGH